MADNVVGGGRARVRRTLARGARRVQHGRPTLSVVVQVVGGDPGDLHETIASVRNQASGKIEILVVGDEAGLAVARDLAGDDTRTTFLAADSVPAARELGVRSSRGSHVLVVSPGDRHQQTLATQVPRLRPGFSYHLGSGLSQSDQTVLADRPDLAHELTLALLAVPRELLLTLVRRVPDSDPRGTLTALHVLLAGFATGLDAGHRYTAERGSPFVPRFDPLPGLDERIARDLAVLDLLADLPEVRREFAGGAIEQLRPFLDAVESATETQWDDLVSHSAELVEALRPTLAVAEVLPRVLALLAAAGRRDLVLDVAAREPINDFPTTITDGYLLADLGIPEGVLPPESFVLHPSESDLVVRARRLVVDGRTVRVELEAGVRHLDSSEVVEVSVTGAGGTPIPLRATVTSDPAVTRYLAEPEHDHDHGLVTIELDVADLHPMMTFAVTWKQDGLSRVGVVLAVATEGSAARLPVQLEDGRSLGAASYHGLIALTCDERPSAPEPTLTRFEVDDDQLRITTARSVDRVRLVGEGRTVEAAPGSPGFWKLPLTADAWGLGEAPLPTGAYRFELSAAGVAVPVVGSRPVVDLVPAEWRTGLHRVQLLLGDDDAVRVRLDPLLTDDEIGVRAQRRLQREFAAISEPLDPRLIYFQSFTGQWANDNPLAIQAELISRRSDLDLRWVVADSSASVPAGTKPVLFRSRAWYDAMSRASYLVTNIELEKWYSRRPGQQVLQTFHGYPSKAMGFGLWKPRGLTPSQIEAQLDHTSRVWNNLVTPAPEMDQYYRRDYAYDGRILALGYPRNDVLVGERVAELRARTRARLGIADGQHAVLYAPTWRDDLATNFRSAQAVHHLDVENAAAALGSDYVLLMRGHRFHAPTRGSGSRVIDVTGHPDINHLIAAADSAVLDYSSLRFDFAITGKPMVFLVPDLETYGSSTRGFLWDYRETAPGPLVATTAEVVAELRDPDRLTTRWSADLVAFNARYNGLHDGRAAERVVSEFFADLL